MSLFKTRDYWSTNAGDGEEYDLGCMSTGDVDNRKDGDKIVLGSYNGYIRIYSPSPLKTEEGWSGFKAQDLLCEMRIYSQTTKQVLPILQVECGYFVSGSNQIHIAVLHPLKISIYTLLMNTGVTDYGAQYQLKIVYEHILQRTSYNFCYGSFGGVTGRDFICVQSMDGMLSIFEQEAFSFSRLLPNSLLPGPLVYVSRIDSFLTVSSSRLVECYKYRILAVANDNTPKDNKLKVEENGKDGEPLTNMKSGKRVSTDWVFELGEQAIKISVLNKSTAPPYVYILGERNFFIISDVGKLINMIKFEFSPSYCLPYMPVAEGPVHLMISTHSSSLIFYSGMTLKWAAQVDFVPVQLKIINLGALCGLILMLSSSGQLNCCYLGTDPAMFNVPSSESRDLDYEKCDLELRELHEKIREHAHKFTVAPSSHSKDEDLTISIEVSKDLDAISRASSDRDVPSTTVRITFKARLPLSKCKLSIDLPPPLVSPDSSKTYANLEPGSVCCHEFTVFINDSLFVPKLTATANIYYEKDYGIPKIASYEFRLPLKLIAHPSHPLKNANFRITIETNKPPVNLNDLFLDMSGDIEGSNALGFKCFYCEDVVTLLASKSSQRYRLQCDTIGPLSHVLEELTRRLRAYNSRGGAGGSTFQMSYEGDLPLQQYCDVIDSHFKCRKDALDMRRKLENKTTEFRSIEKRLLSRFKDKTPTSLNNFDTIIEKCYHQILALISTIEENQRSLQESSNHLSASTRLLLQLVVLSDCQRYRGEELKVLTAALCPDILNGTEQGWEETVDLALTHLLRTTLSRQSRDPNTTIGGTTMPADTLKLKKHLRLLFERISSGANLTTGVITSSDIMAGGDTSITAAQYATNPPIVKHKNSKSLRPIIERNSIPDLDSL